MKSRGIWASPWAWTCIVAVLLGVTIAASYRLVSPDPITGPLATTAPAPVLPAMVQADHTYYVYVKELEVDPVKANGGKWDHLDGSAPDLRYSIAWQGNGVYQSLVRKDQLVAHWDILSVDLTDVVRQKGRVDPQSLISAPLIHTSASAVITLEAWDVDPVGSDAAGKMEIDLMKLHVGDNTIETIPKPMKRLVLSVVDQQQTLTDLVQEINKR